MKRAAPTVIPILFCIMAFNVSAGFSAEPEMRELALRLLKVSVPTRASDKPETSIEDYMTQRHGAEATAKLTPKQREALERIQKKTNEVVKEIGRVHDEAFVECCMDLFTKDELIALIQFYESPVGQKMVPKLPEAVGALMLKRLPPEQRRTPGLALDYTPIDAMEAKYGMRTAQPRVTPDRHEAVPASR